MNPLPQRQLTSQPTLQMQIPNAPPFEPVPFNGRPRKVMPDMKEYPILNGMSNLMSGPQTAPASSASQGSPLDRAGILGSAILQQQQQQPQTGGPLGPQVQLQPAQQSESQQEGKETEGESQRTGQQLTAIFRDENGDWRERLREAYEQTQAGRTSQVGVGAPSGVASWERRSQGDEEDMGKEEEADVEEEEGTEIGEGESGKIWKPKRTLRKSVFVLS